MNEHPRVWTLQEAKARFSEVVRLAQTEGPQTVTVHGKPRVKVSPIDAEEAKEPQTIDDFIRAFQSCPHPEVFDTIDQLRVPAPIRHRKVKFD